MLSNSSLALEIITHDGHQHGAESSAVETLDASSHTEMDASLAMSAMPTIEHGSEDCVCDDICCGSSIAFVSSDSAVIYPRIAESDLDRDDLYQSIALSLLLHPPTA